MKHSSIAQLSSGIVERLPSSFLLCFGTLFLLSSVASAQSIEGGLELGGQLLRSWYAGPVPIYAGAPECGMLGQGQGYGGLVSIGGFLKIGSQFEGYSLLGVGKESLDLFGSTGNLYWTFDPLTRREQSYERSVERQLRWDQFSLEMGLRSYLSRFSVGVGILFSRRFNFEDRQVENLLNTGTSEGKQNQVDWGEMLSLRDYGLELAGSLAYQFPLLHGYLLRVSLSGRYHPASYFTQQGVSSWSIGGGLSLLIPLVRSDQVFRTAPDTGLLPEIPIPPPLSEHDPTFRIPVPQRSQLSVAMDLYTIGEESEKREDAVLRIDRVTELQYDRKQRIVNRIHDRHITAPIVQIDPSYQSDAGLLRWEVELMCGALIVAYYASDVEQSRGDINWQQLDEHEIGDGTTIRGRFTVEDSAGLHKTAFDVMQLQVRKRSFLIVNEILDDASTVVPALLTIPTTTEGWGNDGWKGVDSIVRSFLLPVKHSGETFSLEFYLPDSSFLANDMDPNSQQSFESFLSQLQQVIADCGGDVYEVLGNNSVLDSISPAVVNLLSDQEQKILETGVTLIVRSKANAAPDR